MQTLPIKLYRNTDYITAGFRPQNKTAENNHTTGAIKRLDRSIYDKGSYNISFGQDLIKRYMKNNDEVLYQKSLPKHIAAVKELEPAYVEDYFGEFGIPCDFSGVSKKAKQVIAYGCFNAAEILRQINMVLPTKICVDSFGDNSRTIAACYYYPDYSKNYPIRTVVFNDNYDWENLLPDSLKDYKTDTFHSSNNFMHTFIHEFGHNIHFHKLYSKFGSPDPDSHYIYNPKVANIMDALNMPIYDDRENVVDNPYVSTNVRNIIKDSSGYGSTLLPETFAEEFTRVIIGCMSPMSLRLYRDPFPIITNSPQLNQVLYELWEGLINDGQGLL